MRRTIACLPVLLVCVLPSPAVASGDGPQAGSRHLWATVHVCDTPRHEDVIGVRAQMPGSGYRKQTMWMRVRLQFRSPTDGKWYFAEDPAFSTRWEKVGRHGLYKARQAGWLFDVEPPAEGKKIVMRGVVTFQWRRDGKVKQTAEETTTSGHHVKMADPDGYSRSRCAITA